jgi:PII-like signaling protein
VRRTELQLSIFVRAGDTSAGRPLYEVIVGRARESGLAGATVIVGLAGFGGSREPAPSRLLRRDGTAPVRIEISDEADRVRAFLPVLDGLIGSGLAVLREVTVIRETRPGRPEPDQITASAAP